MSDRVLSLVAKKRRLLFTYAAIRIPPWNDRSEWIGSTVPYRKQPLMDKLEPCRRMANLAEIRDRDAPLRCRMRCMIVRSSSTEGVSHVQEVVRSSARLESSRTTPS